MKRRQVLTAFGATSVFGVAGCIGGSNGGGGVSSGPDAVETYWSALEDGDVETANQVLHETHRDYPVEEPSEDEIPADITFEANEVQELSTVYEETGSRLYDDRAAFESDVEALVEEVGASEYSLVYYAFTVTPEEGAEPGYIDGHYVTAEIDGSWKILSKLTFLPQK